MAVAHSWKQLAAVFQARAKHLEPAWRRGTAEAMRILWSRSRTNMQDMIYANPPDQNKAFYRTKGGGKKALTTGWKARAAKQGRRGGKGFKWTQTGNLLRSEHRRLLSAYQGLISNVAPYAHARHNLALSPGDKDVIPPPPKRKRQSTRIAPWRSQAIRDTEQDRLNAYRRHLLGALRKP